MSENVSTGKVRGQCDICGTFGWVITQYLDGTMVSSQCRRCNRQTEKDEDNDTP